MRHHRHSTIAVMLSFVLSSATLSGAEYLSDDDYMEELKQEVFYPCYEVMLNHMGLEGTVTTKEFHVYMKLTDTTTQRAETAMLNQVRGKPREARAIAYMIGLRSCIKGVNQGH